MTNRKEVFLASDHAGVALKSNVLELLRKEFPESHFKDLGPVSEASVDYPDYAALVASEVEKGKGVGVLICGSGLGMCIAANKFENVRAVSVWDSTSARLSRLHNDANVICLGARLLGPEVAFDAIRTFLKTDFEGGRHLKRVEKIKALEKSRK